MEKGAKPISNKENNLDRPSDGGGGLGPTGSNSGGTNEVVVVDHTILHRDEHVSSSSCLDAKYSATSNPYKSPGEMVPFFTTAQWKELERQAMIYKYMISSMPVPPHLLYPPLHSSLSCALEPGRCKRTDGKKWRCSRDVAPHQKYCERHLHRGRPRSRKPVEEVNINNKKNGDVNHKKPRLQQTPKQFTATNDFMFNAKTDLSGISTAPSHNRDFGLMLESGMVITNNGAEQKWRRDSLEANNMGFVNDEGSSSIYGSTHQDYNVDHFPASEFDVANGFIDASSSVDNLNNKNNVNVESSLSTNHENSFHLLNNLSMIAMAGGNRVLDGKMGNDVRMRDDDGDDSRLLRSPVCCWEAFGPGGPLAEALCASPASPHDSIGAPATTVSSPFPLLGFFRERCFHTLDYSVCK